MRAVGLKHSDTKWSFGLKENSNLCYIITQKKIKPDLNKVQGIMDLRRPNTTTESRELIGMFNYYRDICPRQSHILDPLAEADSVPK